MCVYRAEEEEIAEEALIGEVDGAEGEGEGGEAEDEVHRGPTCEAPAW